MRKTRGRMEELQAKHRKEQRELQSRSTQKKKNATKKTRKGVNDECEILQRDLNEKQQVELDALTSDSISEGINNSHLEKDILDVHEVPESAAAEIPISKQKLTSDEVARPSDAGSTLVQPHDRTKKPNRQKARLARRAAEQEAATAQASVEAAHLPDLRGEEVKAMKSNMVKLNLKETSIRPDGHCLYSAIATNIPEHGVEDSGPYSLPYQDVRLKTANFILGHPDDFAAFLEEPIEEYTRKIKDTAEWGGQLELQAISRAYGVEINVLQADGRVERIEPGVEKGIATEPIWLAYYRHSFGLGEHYNALKKAD